ncbi:sphingomyelin phosphodiesterase [Parashewanella tropica]|uniref:sphingomyelin phosphodiesterase n=1 Tax=Parashewanella tropica TaxID=2547970 RepID=UPI00105A15F1|nr:sphingomyelin phosphodiesterase [Parashewanella tropica]
MKLQFDRIFGLMTAVCFFFHLNLAHAELFNTYIANNTDKEICTVPALKTQPFFSISDGASSEDCLVDNVQIWIGLSIKNNRVQASIKTPDTSLPFSDSNLIRRVNIHGQHGNYEIAVKASGDSATFAITPLPNKSLITDANKLSILTYNLWGTSIYGAKKVSTRFAEMPKYFHNYDVLAFEEQFDVAPTQALHKALKSEYPYQTTKLKKADKPLQAGIYLLSRYPILKQASMIYNACNGLQCLTSKGVIYVEIIKNGQKYHIFDTHTQSGTSAKDVQARMQQVVELETFIKSQQVPDKEPIIISGDFNIDMIHEQENYTDMLTLLNVTHPDSTGYPLTYDKDVNKWSDDEHSYVDYLMYDNAHLLPISSSLNVIEPRSTIAPLWNYWDLSDHFAVEGVFEYATPSQN